jgi:hypothetical protein
MSVIFEKVSERGICLKMKEFALNVKKMAPKAFEI